MATIMQNEDEINWFGRLLATEGARSYLEIGSKFGDSLECVAMALPKGSRIVSIDLPGGERDTAKKLRATIDRLNAAGYDAHLIIGDSTDMANVEKARRLGPFDACFIDGNHTLPYITKDWENYGPMCCIVGFHDISFEQNPTLPDKRIHAPQFWESIKVEYRHQECRLQKRHNGIGVLWRR